MCEVIDIREQIHDANVRRIARRVLTIIGSQPLENNLVTAIHYKIPEVNNWFLLAYIINRCFPSPTLVRLQHPGFVEDVVIEEIIREGLLHKHKSITVNNGIINTDTLQD